MPKRKFITPQNAAKAVLLIGLGILGPSYAEVGDTMAQARAKYGTPAGRIATRNATMLIYDTAQGRIVETYDADGIAIEFQPDDMSLLNPRETTAEKPHVEIPAAPPAEAEASTDANPEPTGGERGHPYRTMAWIGTTLSVLLGALALFEFKLKHEKRDTRIPGNSTETEALIIHFDKLYQNTVESTPDRKPRCPRKNAA